MDISKIDPMLSSSLNQRDDIVWRSATDTPFSIHGVFYDKNENVYLRMPTSVTTKVSRSVEGLARMTSGGRVRFKTDSPCVAIFCIAPTVNPMPHMPLTGSHGFAVYRNGQFVGKIVPSVNEVITPHEEGIVFGGVVNLSNAGVSEIEIYMPLYGGVKELKIGVQENTNIFEAREYTYKKPLVIYGSSITQGACASRPGNDFAMRLSRLLDADVINLGFSGNGNAEPEMLEYIANIDATAFIFDYNYYSCRPDRVLPPHFEIYSTLRTAHPKTPILMIDKPGFIFAGKDYPIRSKMIRDTYERAVAQGDTLVDMMDASELFGSEDPDACLVDTDHPNDLGFYRMADNIYTKLSKLLKSHDKD